MKAYVAVLLKQIRVIADFTQICKTNKDLKAAFNNALNFTRIQVSLIHSALLGC